MKTPQPIENASSPDLRGSWPALQRAAQRARQIAAQTGTALVVVRDGTVEHIDPKSAQPVDNMQKVAPTHGKLT